MGKISVFTPTVIQDPAFPLATDQADTVTMVCSVVTVITLSGAQVLAAGWQAAQVAVAWMLSDRHPDNKC